AFVIIQLPPGDYLTSYVMQLRSSGTEVSEAEIAALTRQYGLDRPLSAQYLMWARNIVTRGDFGRSFNWNRPVSEIIWERIGITALIGALALLFSIVVAIPVGIMSALRQYSFGDYLFTVFGYIGLATPNFLMAMILLFFTFRFFGVNIGGLFSPEFMDAPWSVARFIDMLNHLWAPVIVLGTADAAGLIRVMRGMMLDELRKQYVVTARARGLKESKLILKYPVRVALNPVASTIGWRIVAIISGAPIVAVVFSLPTTGPVLLRALMSQDMYLAGALVLLLSTMTVIGTFISDLVLALLDPRIRLGE
ncbi:MAG: ABC transporter permease, partial [Spirochaetaceae bacterium]